MTTPNQLTNLLYGPGDVVPGSVMTDEEALAHARKNFAHMEFCLVRDWIWVDLDVSEEQRLHLAQTQRQPALIYAHSVVYDSARRWDVGDFVRTSLLSQFAEGFQFKTLNTVYLLLGPGTRKHCLPEIVSSIF
ncbi:hypothetical protein QOZ52_02795 [Pseudomonas aeruginosa]|uniref:DUF6957 family protein n=1 Tax=Pseudomonas aeruginosa TaxID=287 RepID=UPI0014476622|nr:hypothetical protein [Pseudomonas aeruginosa]EKX8709409.1 hypothetical protein [Pseudomonas aeruginosa]MBI8609437.1 hypothetical protein [Pseudomonas aeruginosa]HBO3489835.1 hypothetical protein [Pseudomonas aeruginosa]HCG1027144.1 hypothetical protein [Pseudomonas aeruginosa]